MEVKGIYGGSLACDVCLSRLVCPLTKVGLDEIAGPV